MGFWPEIRRGFQVKYQNGANVFPFITSSLGKRK